MLQRSKEARRSLTGRLRISGTMIGGGMADRQLTAALAGAAASATAALNAPSIRTALAISDAQPWRWVVRPESMDLYADASRRLATLDPDRRLLMMSCGGSLHHARVALAAEGLAARVNLFPDTDPDHLAVVTAPDRIEVTKEAKELYQATGQPHTERQRIADTPPSPPGPRRPRGRGRRRGSRHAHPDPGTDHGTGQSHLHQAEGARTHRQRTVERVRRIVRRHGHAGQLGTGGAGPVGGLADRGQADHVGRAVLRGGPTTPAAGT